MKTIKIPLHKGFTETEVISESKYSGRKLILHLNYMYNPEFYDKDIDNKYTVSDYSTGMGICHGNNKRELMRLAKDRVILVNNGKASAKWSELPILNT